MNTLLEILSTVGYAMINSIWQMALLLSIYWLAVWLFSPSAESRYRLGLFLLTCGTFWFTGSIGAAPPLEPAAYFLLAFHTETVSLAAVKWIWWLSLVSGTAYPIMIGWFAITGRRQWQWFNSINKNVCHKAPVEWRLFTQKHALWMGIGRSVKLVLAGVDMPSTFGWLKPVILLPVGCFTQLSPSQLEAVLLHELAHIKRNDYLWGLVAYVNQCVMWFNPFARLLINAIRREAEHACDDLVLHFEYEPSDFAFALLQLAKNSQSTSLTLAAGGNNAYELLGRVERLLNQKEPVRKFNLNNTLFMAFFLILSVAVYFTGAVQKKEPTLGRLTESLPQKPYSKSPQRQQWMQYPQSFNMRGHIAKKQQSVPAQAAPPAKQLPEYPKINKREKGSLATNKPADESHVQETTQVLLSAGWLEENYASGNSEQNPAGNPWPVFATLLERLDQTGKLDEDQWRRLMQYILLHQELQETIARDAQKQQNLLVPAARVTSMEEAKVLLIVYDEEMGTLAAAMVAQNLLAEEVTLKDVPDSEVQVVFLHRKTGSKPRPVKL